MAYDANFSESATFNATFAGNAIDAVSDEVIDIRTGYDGTVYPSAGDAVRSQIEEAMESGGSSVPTAVRSAILTLFESAAYAETGLTDEIAIVESWASEVTEISLSATTLSLNGDTPQTLVATTAPSGSAVVWSSSDSTIATVVGGVVTGVSNGACRITAFAGTKSATCAVTVTGFAELVSISAVYTQSDNEYGTNTDIDDLRDNLVVTATYDDASTEVITDYVLSGTLEVGTSTITVIYGGKTTTFSVTVDYLYIIYADALTRKKALHHSYPYVGTANDSKRISYTAFDILMDGGKTYEIIAYSTTGISTPRMGIQTFNQNVLDAVAESVDYNMNDIHDPGWFTTYSDGAVRVDVALPVNVNSSPSRGCRLTFSLVSNATIPDSFIVSKITIREVTE